MNKIVVVLVLAAAVGGIAYIQSVNNAVDLATAANFEKIQPAQSRTKVIVTLGQPQEEVDNPTVNPKARRDKASDGFWYATDGFFAGHFLRWTTADRKAILLVQMNGESVSGVVQLDLGKFKEDNNLATSTATPMTLIGGSGGGGKAPDGVAVQGSIKIVPKV
ncbi:MAG: hypothetical protein NTW19_19415 [Planctomycetota bacterium]|nr:hypothetical protein [Planctomycetota bacterium]